MRCDNLRRFQYNQHELALDGVSRADVRERHGYNAAAIRFLHIPRNHVRFGEQAIWSAAGSRGYKHLAVQKSGFAVNERFLSVGIPKQIHDLIRRESIQRCESSPDDNTAGDDAVLKVECQPGTDGYGGIRRGQIEPWLIQMVVIRDDALESEGQVAIGRVNEPWIQKESAKGQRVQGWLVAHISCGLARCR